MQTPHVGLEGAAAYELLLSCGRLARYTRTYHSLSVATAPFVVGRSASRAPDCSTDGLFGIVSDHTHLRIGHLEGLNQGHNQQPKLRAVEPIVCTGRLSKQVPHSEGGLVAAKRGAVLLGPGPK